MKPALLLSAVATLACVATGCTRVEYLDYCGVQSWPQGSAFVHTVRGIQVYEGLPNREYEVVGLVDVYDDKPFYHDDGTCGRVIGLAKEHNGDAIIWLSDRTVSSGYLKMKDTAVDPASLGTGRSSQPELIVTNVSQNTATSYKKSLRSSLLVIKWKK